MIQGAGRNLTKTTSMNTFHPSAKSEAFITEPSSIHMKKINARQVTPSQDSHSTKKTRQSKGYQAAPLIRTMLQNSTYWFPITSSDDYQYPGVFKASYPQRLGYCEDVTKLGLYTSSNPDFMYYDIQLGKGKPRNPQTVTVTTSEDKDGQQETLQVEYKIAPCKGIKLCGRNEEGCDYVTSTREHRPCLSHPSVPLVACGSCPVEFVYIRPTDKNDNRRWQTGFLRGGMDMMQAQNLHSHQLPPATRIPTKVQVDIKEAVKEDAHLKTTDIVEGMLAIHVQN